MREPCESPRRDPRGAGCPRRAQPRSTHGRSFQVQHSVVLHHRNFRHTLAFTMAVFNLLTQWYGLPCDTDGFVSLSMAEFSL